MMRSLTIFILILVTTVTLVQTTRSIADPTTINLNFPASDGMTVTDCLKVVAMETGAVLLPDNSVLGEVGAIHASESSIPDILNDLKGFEPGLTWQIVYYPSYSNSEPAGETLYQAIQELQALDIDGLVLPPAGDDKVMISVKKQMYTTPEQEKAAETGCQIYYLISDPTNRAMIAKNLKPGNTPPAAMTDKPTHFLATINDLQNQLAQMSPQQQVTAMNEMAAAYREINQTLSPQVLAALHSQNTGRQQPQ